MANETSQKMQYAGSAVILLLMLANGASNGWNSPSVPHLLSNSTSLPSGQLNEQQVSWMAANICLGSIIGAVIFGWFNDMFGRKATAYAASMLQMIGWFFLVYAVTPLHLYISRFLVGFGGVAAFIVVPIYITEISESHVRGFLASMGTVCSNIGVLGAFFAGAFVPCFIAPWIFIPLNVVLFIAFFQFPETPTYLAKKGDYNKAEESLLFYRGLKSTIAAPISVMEELSEIKAICAHLDPVERRYSSITTKEVEVQKHTTASSPSVIRRALVISQVIFLLQQLSGCFPMLQFTELILQKANSSVSPKFAAVIIAFIQVIGSYIATLLTERAGRRLLFLSSSVGTALGWAVFGTYFLLDKMGMDLSSVSWLPLAAFSFVILIANCGLISLTYLVGTEILPNEVKSFGSSIGNFSLNATAFGFMLLIPPLIDTCLYTLMYIFSASCMAGAVFLYFYLPETKGKTAAEISMLLERGR